MEEWRIRPTIIDNWDEGIDTVMAIDESGTIDLKGIRKKIKDDFFAAYSNRDSIVSPHDRWFSITGVVMNRDHFSLFRDSINSIKYGHWNDGKFQYKKGLQRVVFHSSEIRKRVGPFNPKLIDYGILMSDITNLVEQTNFKIFSSAIDKINHVLSYSNPFPVYDLCLDFIIERYCMYLNTFGKSGILMLESRGKKEDKMVLQHLMDLLDNGNYYHDSNHFKCIKGVYFNPKWCFKQEKQASFILLELADLISYPIYKYVSTGNQDLAFNVFEKKIYNYPHYNGYGLKKFPINKKTTVTVVRPG
jgi:hypothetical protein